MKLKLLSLAAAALLFASCSTPSYTSTSSNAAYTTPADLQTSFATQYPTATNATWSAYDASTASVVDWELSGWPVADASSHTVAFDMDGNRYNAWYSADGTWIGSTYAVSDYTKLPEAVHTTVKEKYSGYTIDKVQQEMWKDKTAYELKLKNADKKMKVLIDGQGNVLKEKMKD